MAPPCSSADTREGELRAHFGVRAGYGMFSGSREHV